MKKRRLIELFSGVGAQAKALKNMGMDFEHYRAVDFDKYAMRSYNAIHGTVFKTSDITRMSGSDLGIVDTDQYDYWLTYSFPCQDLSNAGKGKGMSKGTGTRSGLLWEVERLLKESKELPRVLIMENVPQVHSKKNKPDFDRWIRFLEEQGYNNYYQDLNAKNYGIPQNRNRCFMVSLQSEKAYKFPQAKELTFKLKDMLEKEVDEKYYVKPTNLININGKIVTIKEATKKGYAEATIGDSINLEQPNSKTRRGRVGHGVAQTITTSPQQAAVEPNYRIRKLTPKECWRLMGFSDVDFDKAAEVNSNTQLYKQAGNSIVVPVLEAIFRNIIKLGG